LFPIENSENTSNIHDFAIIVTNPNTVDNPFMLAFLKRSWSAGKFADESKIQHQFALKNCSNKLINDFLGRLCKNR
jgi:hypothetical protein